MLKVGVAGIGMMGSTHLETYSRLPGVKVVAVADLIEERREGRTTVAGNVKGQASEAVDFSVFRKYDEAHDLIADPELDIVDICLPTPLHATYAKAALAAGKHVLTEKPFARTAAEARSLAHAAEASDKLLMCAMCMRFWPAWAWLKEAVATQRYGKVLGAHFRRLTNLPPGPFYADGAANGGAILDLHIHDTDFINYCFGKPRAVFSRGYRHATKAVDHLVTHYIYDDIPLVTAEGGWSLAEGFGFEMLYTVNFEQATALFNIGAEEQLLLCRDGARQVVEVAPGTGYQHEIAYFLECVRSGQRPAVIDPASAALSVAIVEAEERSIDSGQVEPIA